MKKIMFNEQFGLQQATFAGLKTMTRRAVPNKTIKDALAYQSHHIDDEKAYEKYILDHAQYKVGEIVAIAQRYEDLANGGYLDIMMDGPLSMKKEYSGAGYKNKMFVKPELMPHHIKITGIKVEGLRDISDEDCLKEGIITTDLHSYTVGDYLLWDKHLRQRAFSTPFKAFEILIKNLYGEKFWYRNPLVLAYTFELANKKEHYCPFNFLLMLMNLLFYKPLHKQSIETNMFLSVFGF